jgi:tetratricopeptide (TPR) repeat protein
LNGNLSLLKSKLNVTILPRITFKIALLLPISELFCPLAFGVDPSENPPAKTSVPALYRSALEDYQHNRWGEAREKFQKIAQAAPESLLAYEASFFAILTRIELDSDSQATRSDEPRSDEPSGELTWDLEVWQCEVASRLKEWEASPKADQSVVRSAIVRLRSRIAQAQVEQAKCFLREKQWVWASHTLSSLRGEVGDSYIALSSLVGPLTEKESLERESFRSWIDRSELECCVQLRRWNRAEELLQQLQPSLLAYLAQREPPAWVSQVLLCRSEIAILKGDWELAELTVCDIRAHFPECNERGYVDYLYARCLVFNARFDEARQVFESIVRMRPTPPAELLAKAWWATAESFVMQRRHTEAIAAFEHVLSLDVDPQWKSIVERQMADCRSAIGTPLTNPSVPPVQTTQRPTSVPKR